MNVCAFTSICREDMGWVLGYLAEIDRLGIDFVVHLDRCARADIPEVCEMVKHPRCVGMTSQDSTEFNEMHKQGVLDLIDSKRAYRWAMAMDADEVFEKNAPDKLSLLDAVKGFHVQVKWVNLWGDKSHIRVDGPFASSHRVKFYRLDAGIRWVFTSPITNGPKPYRCNSLLDESAGLERIDLTCLHAGLMTRELRVLHKKRWDRIYSAAVGGNPYGMWDYALNEDRYPPTVERNPYL
jgi:hypothetical protein